jgi:hypothetical protein
MADRLRAANAGAKTVAPVALALALAGCAGSGEGRPPSRLPAPDLPVREIARRLEPIRGLRFKRVPDVRVASRSQFRKIESRLAAATIRGLSKRDRARATRLRAEARIAERLPVLLGLMDRLPRQAAVDKSAKVQGVYVGVEDRVYLISDHAPGRRRAESVLSHELTHALEQQNLGTDKPQLTSPFSDASDARFAVKEGSATLTELRYARRYLGDRDPIGEKLREPAPDPTGSRLDRYLRDGADFSYRRGTRFVRALYRRGGAQLVNQAVRRPPVTTASIFDPSRWPARDRPLAPAGRASPGPGWARSYLGNFGAATTHQLLFLGAPGEAADRLVRDWRGGTVELWQRPASVRRRERPARADSVTVIRWRWASPSDAAVAAEAIDPYLRAGFHARPAPGGVWRWRGGGAALASSGSTTTLVIAPTAETAAATADWP